MILPTLVILKNYSINDNPKNLPLMKSVINSVPLFVLGFIALIFFRSMIDSFYLNSEIWGNIFKVSEKITTILFGLALTALGASAVRQGLSVVHYSMELSEHYVGARYDTVFTKVPSSDLKSKKDYVKEKIKGLQ